MARYLPPQCPHSGSKWHSLQSAGKGQTSVRSADVITEGIKAITGLRLAQENKKRPATSKQKPDRKP